MIEEIPNLLSKGECDALIKCHFSHLGCAQTPPQGVDFWKGRSLSFGQIKEEFVQAREIMKRLSSRLIDRLKNRHTLDYMDLVLWPEGTEMAAHIDNSHGYDRHRVVSSLTYLNDDFEGGETFFPSLNRTVTPERGKMLVFDSSILHGVKRVATGIRYTFPIWLKNSES